MKHGGALRHLSLPGRWRPEGPVQFVTVLAGSRFHGDELKLALQRTIQSSLVCLGEGARLQLSHAPVGFVVGWSASSGNEAIHKSIAADASPVLTDS